MARLTGTPQQQAIWETLIKGRKNVVVKALAGTGKTTLIVEAVNRLPSGLSVAVVCFNKPIATHLQNLIPRHKALCCTTHSLGGNAVSRATNKSFRDLVDEDKVPKMLPPQTSPLVRSATIKLVGLVKSTLTEPTNENLEALAVEYNIDIEHNLKPIATLVRMCLDKSKEPGTMDYNDMLWLPVVWALPVKRYDIMFVDEGQDLNRCQQELMTMSADRICLVGDENQSIYGFRGADHESMERMEVVLDAQPRNVEVMPLSVTWRCLPAIVEKAQAIVPQFECEPTIWARYQAWKQSGEAVVPEEFGMVKYNSKQEYKRGDLVLCRTNAPLISEAYSLIAQNIPIKVQGRDIGAQLASFVKRILPQGSVLDLITLLGQYREKEMAKLMADPNKQITNEAKMQNLADKCDCVAALSEGMDTVQQILDRINVIFANVKDDDYRNFVLFSSVHRAKGMEADVVFILEPELMPHPMASTPAAQQQERNLMYVAWTRAKKELHFR